MIVPLPNKHRAPNIYCYYCLDRYDCSTTNSNKLLGQLNLSTLFTWGLRSILYSLNTSKFNRSKYSNDFHLAFVVLLLFWYVYNGFSKLYTLMTMYLRCRSRNCWPISIKFVTNICFCNCLEKFIGRKSSIIVSSKLEGFSTSTLMRRGLL